MTLMTAEQFDKALYNICLNNGLYQPEHLLRVDHHCTSHEVDEDINPDYYGLALEELERIVENRTFVAIATGDFYDRPAILDQHLNAALAALNAQFGKEPA
jgi:DNA-binding GntR family transcriptional regulator